MGREAGMTIRPKYDSDEDLPEDIQKKIKDMSPRAAEELRNKSWEEADLYPKLKSTLKTAWYGDKRAKK